MQCGNGHHDLKANVVQLMVIMAINQSMLESPRTLPSLPLPQLTLLKYEFPLLAGGVGTHVFLQISVLVVVDPQTLVPEEACRVLDQTGLAG